MVQQPLHERIVARQPTLGLFLGIPSPALVEMIGHAGFDFVVLDNEHGPAGIETTEHMVRAAASTGLPAIVRVSGVDQREIQRTLDVGIAGVQAPQVNTLAQAEALVRAARFPPLGQRGVAFSTRAARFGFGGGAAYLEQANAQIQVVAHIETVEALNNLDSLLAVEGIDIWFIGPTDLSVSLGYPGQPNHPEVRRVIDSTISQIKQANRAVGLMVTSSDEWHHYAQQGVSYLTMTLTGLLGGSLRETIAAVRR
jgi:4-hydroxy-2-oxoheptanedioate aldolase